MIGAVDVVAALALAMNASVAGWEERLDDLPQLVRDQWSSHALLPHKFLSESVKLFDKPAWTIVETAVQFTLTTALCNRMLALFAVLERVVLDLPSVLRR